MPAILLLATDGFVKGDNRPPPPVPYIGTLASLAAPTFRITLRHHL